MDVIGLGEMREPANQNFPMKLFKRFNIIGLSEEHGFQRPISRQPLLSCTVHNPELPGRWNDRKSWVLRGQKNHGGPRPGHTALPPGPAILTVPHERVIGLYGV